MKNIRDWFLQIALALIIFFGFLRPYVIEAFRIPSPSMEATLLIGDHILVLKAMYGQRIPYAERVPPLLSNLRGEDGLGRLLPATNDVQAGDVIVFRYPVDLQRDFIKRCVAIAGDTVSVRNDTLYVNGEPSQYALMYQDFRDRRFGGNSIIDSAWPDSLPYLRGRIPELSLYEIARGCTVDPSTGRLMEYIVPDNYCFVMGDNRDHSNDGRVWGPLSLDLVKGKALITYWSWVPGQGVPKIDRIARLIF